MIPNSDRSGSLHLGITPSLQAHVSLEEALDRLALVFRGQCVVRYDNERGKGDHRHIGASETAYTFTTVDDLVADFFQDARRWLDEHGDD